MRLEDLDTSRCLYDPKSSALLNDMRKIKEFNIQLSYRLSLKKILSYIILMYDMDSPLWREVRELPARKAVAMEISGYPMDKKTGRFDRPLEIIMEGGNEQVNAMIVKYMSMLNNPKWTQIITYEAIYYKEVGKVINNAYGKAKDTIQTIQTLSDALRKLRTELIGGDGEAEPIMAAIYKETSKGLSISPEAIAKYIEESEDVPEDWNPYSKWSEDGKRIIDEYKVDKIKFVGDR